MSKKLLSLRAAACDLNGQMRGKRLPLSDLDKLKAGYFRMPFSALNVDIWGRDIEASPLVFETGDADGFLLPTERNPLSMPSLRGYNKFVPMWMFNDDSTPFEADPRHALKNVLENYSKRGWQVIAATELEFFLVDDTSSKIMPPKNPLNNRPLCNADTLSLDQLDIFEIFFNDLYQACDEMGINTQSATSECGVGQFEMSLKHCDAMEMADNTWFFKSLVRALARKHKMAATFMAKPFDKDAGNGLHVHFSVIDENGVNIFDDGTEFGSCLLKNAVAGCLQTMQASTLIFAPYPNSYKRLVDRAHAPTSVCWAYENRTSAIRIPSGVKNSRRIEHRVAGGDVNPYLLFCSILGSAFLGIDENLKPSEPVIGNAYNQNFDRLLPDIETALSIFEKDAMITKIFHCDLIKNFCTTKRQEIKTFENLEDENHWETYLDKV